jgi:preprotein translocase subunit SecD
MSRALAVVAVLVCTACGGGHGEDDSWFRISGEDHIGPTLDAGDVAAQTARADSDPATGQSVVSFGFTRDGRQKFTRLTREVAHRGARAGRPFHIVITVDGRLKERPYIDYAVSPDGLPATAAYSWTSRAEPKR